MEKTAENNGRCSYCGDYASARDHVIPRALSRCMRGNLVPVCDACNCAGSDWVFKSFEEKKRYILLRRFGEKSHSREFIELTGAYRARSRAWG